MKPDDKAYFLGDAIDRGPGGVKILQELLMDNRITCLKGNHEEFLEAYYRWQTDEDIIYQRDYLSFLTNWNFNGGSETQKQLAYLANEEFDALYNKVAEMPYYLKIDNKHDQHFYLSHAGFDPWISDDEYYWKYKQRCGYSLMENRYTWDRDHFYRPWWQPCFGRIDNEEYMKSYVVHGHTPVQYFTSWDDSKPEVHFYSKDDKGICHKIDLDLGSFDSGRIALFDIDTFKVIYFDRRES